MSGGGYGSLGGMASMASQMADTQLRQAQHLAESGAVSWKIAACVGGAGMIFVSFCALPGLLATCFLYPVSLVMNIFVFCFGVLTVMLEYKERLMTQRYLDVIRKEALFLSRPYGRAAFYFFLGFLVMSENGMMTLAFFVGLYTSIIGAVIFIASRSAMSQFAAIKSASFDEATIRRKFEAADKDKNGTLDSAELAVICADLGCHLTRNELEAALVVLDKDGNGAISFDEFIEWYSDKNDV